MEFNVGASKERSKEGLGIRVSKEKSKIACMKRQERR